MLALEEEWWPRRIWAKIVGGVYGVLYLVSKDPKSSTLSVVITSLINTFQLCSLAFSPDADFPWNTSLKNAIQPLTEIFHLAFDESLRQLGLLSFGINLFMLVTTVSMLIIMAKEFANGTVKRLWVLPLLQFELKLLTTIMYMPMINTMLAIFKCNNLYEEILGCGNWTRTLVASIFAVILVIFIIFSGLVVVVFGDRNPRSPNPEAASHRNVDLVIFLGRTILEFSFYFTVKHLPVGAIVSIQTKKALIALVVLSSFVFTFTYAFYLPYYSTWTNKVVVLAMGTYLWSAIVLLITWIINDPDDMTSLFMFGMGTPFFLYTLVRLVDRRIKSIQKFHKNAITSPYIAELKLRYDYDLMAPGTRDQYKEVLEQFPTSGFLLLHVAMLMEQVWNDKEETIYYYQVAETLELGFDLRFIMYQRSLRSKEEATGTKGAISYLAFDFHAQNAQSSMRSCLQLLYLFWRALALGGFTVQELYKISIELNARSQESKHHISELQALTSDVQEVMKLEILYQQFVVGNEEVVRSLLACQMELPNMMPNVEAIQSMFVKAAKRYEITFASNSDVKKIQYVSDDFLSFLGVSEDQLRNQPFNVITYEPFWPLLYSYLSREFKTTHDYDLWPLKAFWFSHHEGFNICFERVVFMKGDDENTITVKFTNPQEHLNAGYYMLVDMSSRVLACSEHLLDAFEDAEIDIEPNCLIHAVVPEIRNIDTIDFDQLLRVRIGDLDFFASFEKFVVHGNRDNKVHVYKILFSKKSKNAAGILNQPSESNISIRSIENTDPRSASASSLTMSHTGKTRIKSTKKNEMFSKLIDHSAVRSPWTARFFWISKWQTRFLILILIMFNVSSWLVENSYVRELGYAGLHFQRSSDVMESSTMVGYCVQSAENASSICEISELSTVNSNLKQLHRDLMAAETASGSFYVVDMLPSSLWISILEYTSHVAAYVDFEFPNCGTACTKVVESGTDTVLPAILAAFPYYSSQMEISRALWATISTTYLAITIALSICLALLWYIPVISRTLQQRHLVINAFQLLPVETLLRMEHDSVDKLRNYKRLAKLLNQPKRKNDDAESSDEDSDSDMEDTELHAMSVKFGFVNRAKSKAPWAKTRNSSSFQSFVSMANISLKTKLHEGLKGNESIISRFMTWAYFMFAMALSNIIVIVFFVLVLIFTTSQTSSLSLQDHSLFAVAQFGTTLSELMFWMRNNQTQVYERVQNLVDELEPIHAALQYGNSYVAPIHLESTYQYELYVEGMCSIDGSCDSNGEATVSTDSNVFNIDFGAGLFQVASDILKRASESAVIGGPSTTFNITQSTLLSRAYTGSVQASQDTIDATVQNRFLIEILATLGVIVLAFVSSYVARRIFEREEKGSKSNLFLLAMLPEKEYDVCPELMAYVDKHI